MSRRKSPKSSDFGSSKPGYFQKLAMGTAHRTYDVKKEGLGSEAEWASAFNVRMGFEEAQEYKRTSKRKWGSDWQVLSDIAGIHIDKDSVWSDVKKAFRKASMNSHPDRTTQHGKSVDVATEEFKSANAAFAMLEDIYRTEGRLD